MNRHLITVSLLALFEVATGAESRLIVVEDSGGDSAQPYYDSLHRAMDKPRAAEDSLKAAPSLPRKRYEEADLLPVHSRLLRPGPVSTRRLNAPGLRPMFLVGDDTTSRLWLQKRVDDLRNLGAVGFVVEVPTRAALDELRRLVPGVTLTPASGDDLAQRLGLQHFPVLITSTSIEQ